jgi:hypothetical protein
MGKVEERSLKKGICVVLVPSAAHRNARRLQTYFRTSAVAVLVFLLSMLNVGFAQSSQRARESASTAAGSSQLARGKYIVEDVAVCSQCHTPHNSARQLDQSKWLEGGPLWLRPAEPVENWPLQVPRIAGNPPGTDAEMIRLLTTGVWRDNKQLRPPMPQFRLSVEDAQAVIAYLKTLTPKD